MLRVALVVPCVNRKAFPASPGHQARNLPSYAARNRAEIWCAQVKNHVSPKIPVSQLYSGESWAQSRLLERLVSDYSSSTNTFVASAGMGLISINDQVPSYAATFSTGHLDSVASSGSESQEWWAFLSHTLNRENLADVDADMYLLALSKTYSRALQLDIRELEERHPGRIAVFGSSIDVAPNSTIHVHAGMQSQLGGSMLSLNIRAAAHWFKMGASLGFMTSAHIREWHSFAQSSPVHRAVNRAKATDSELRDIIEMDRRVKIQNGLPSSSKTQLHRWVRSQGLACSQERFNRLFVEMGFGSD